MILGRAKGSPIPFFKDVHRKKKKRKKRRKPYTQTIKENIDNFSYIKMRKCLLIERHVIPAF